MKIVSLVVLGFFAYFSEGRMTMVRGNLFEGESRRLRILFFYEFPWPENDPVPTRKKPKLEKLTFSDGRIKRKHRKFDRPRESRRRGEFY